MLDTLKWDFIAPWELHLLTSCLSLNFKNISQGTYNLVVNYLLNIPKEVHPQLQMSITYPKPPCSKSNILSLIFFDPQSNYFCKMNPIFYGYSYLSDIIWFLDLGYSFSWILGLWLYRWAMFGFAVGVLTEYATGSNFVDQVKILLSNFGIVDLEWCTSLMLRAIHTFLLLDLP